jgi:hypothetical protein
MKNVAKIVEHLSAAATHPNMTPGRFALVAGTTLGLVLIVTLPAGLWVLRMFL